MFNYLRRRCALIGIAFLLLITAFRLWEAVQGWPSASGGEAFWVAQSIASGHGHSVTGEYRWMFSDFVSTYPADEYFPTAITEPVYPRLLAFAFTIFGEEKGTLAILLLQAIAVALSPVAVFYLGKKVFNRSTGMLAAFLLALWPHSIHLELNPASIMSLLVSVAALLSLWCMANPSVAKGIVLGLLLGISALTHTTTFLFIPVAALSVFFSRSASFNRLRLQPHILTTSLAIIVSSLIVIFPWTIRNYSAFGEFVLIRSGAGLNIHQGSTILAGTFAPGPYACTNTLGPLWDAQAKNALDTVRLSRKGSKLRKAIYKRSYDCIEQNAPKGYEQLNEPQRDKVYLAASKAFIFSEPKTFARLSFYKVLYFIAGWNPVQNVVGLLAVVGLVLSWRNRHALVLTLFTLVYAFPYVLTVQWFYRYRYPIEPLFLVLASYALVQIASKAALTQKTAN